MAKSKNRLGTKYTDHLGNSYDTPKDMCAEYGIDLKDFKRLFKSGIALEQILIGNSLSYECSIGLSYRELLRRNKALYADRVGNTYKSLKELCTSYGITLFDYFSYIQGHSIFFEDKFGNVFRSIYEFCSVYEVSYSDAVKLLESASVTDRPVIVSETLMKAVFDLRFKYCPINYVCVDAHGKVYSNLSEMCKTYEVNISTFLDRLKRGMSLITALGTESEAMKVKVSKYNDFLGNSYRTISSLRTTWGFIDEYSLREHLNKSNNLLTRDALYLLRVAYDNECYGSIKELTMTKCISLESLLRRMRKGGTLCKALSEELLYKGESKRRSYSAWYKDDTDLGW